MVSVGECSSPHGDHPYGHHDLWEALLLLDVQHLQAGLLDDALHDVQVANDAAVGRVQLAALPRHVVLDDDDAVAPQRVLGAHQELHQVLVRQVACKETCDEELRI